MSGLGSLRVLAPYAGENLMTGAFEVPKNTGLRVENMLPGRAGKLYLRGPMTRIGFDSSPIAAHATMPGFWAAPDDPDRIMYKQSAAGFNMISPGTLPGGGWTSPASWTTVPKRDHVIYGIYTFGALSHNGGSGARAPIGRWDGVGATANMTTVTNGPDEVQAMTVFASRLMVLADKAPNTSGAGFAGLTHLYWTDPNWDGTDTAAVWQDDVSGLVNKITLPSTQWHTLITVYDTMYIMGPAGILSLRGSGPSNWVLKKISSVPCFRDYVEGAPAAIAVDDGMYFQSDQGIMFFDGVKARPASDPIRQRLSLGQGGLTEVVRLSSDYLAWRIGDTNVDTFAVWYMYHMPTGSWSRLSSTLFATGIPKWIGKTNAGAPWAANSTVWTTLENIAVPENLNAIVAPATTYCNGKDGDTTPIITGTVRSRLIDLGNLSTKVQLNRIKTEVVLQQLGVDGPATATLNVCNEAGTVLATGSVNSDTVAGKKLISIQAFNEVDKVFLEWVIASNARQYVQFEIHDAVIDYQAARRQGN